METKYHSVYYFKDRNPTNLVIRSQSSDGEHFTEVVCRLGGAKDQRCVSSEGLPDGWQENGYEIGSYRRLRFIQTHWVNGRRRVAAVQDGVAWVSNAARFFYLQRCSRVLDDSICVWIPDIVPCQQINLIMIYDRWCEQRALLQGCHVP